MDSFNGDRERLSNARTNRITSSYFFAINNLRKCEVLPLFEFESLTQVVGYDKRHVNGVIRLLLDLFYRERMEL